MKAEQLATQLKGTGRRMTVQRRAVFDALAKLGCAQDAMEIYLQARRACPQLGLVTVYRTLEALTAQGLVYSLYLGDGRTRYELTEEGHHHHHLVCLGCGTIEMLEGCLIKTVEGTRLGPGFEVTSHRLELYGYCKACGRKRKHSRPQGE